MKETFHCKRNFPNCNFALTDFLSIEMCTNSPGPTMCVCCSRNSVITDFIIMKVDCMYLYCTSMSCTKCIKLHANEVVTWCGVVRLQKSSFLWTFCFTDTCSLTFNGMSLRQDEGHPLSTKVTSMIFKKNFYNCLGSLILMRL